MEYAAADSSFSLPLWHHGRMFLVPTAEWISVSAKNGNSYRIPQCSENEAQILALAARDSLEIWGKTDFETRQNLFKNLGESLEKLTAHFAGLCPADFENAESDIQNAVEILKNPK